MRHGKGEKGQDPRGDYELVGSVSTVGYGMSSSVRECLLLAGLRQLPPAAIGRCQSGATDSSGAKAVGDG
ncbi:hypothetical protein D9M68_546600 [compost metagenome]